MRIHPLPTTILSDITSNNALNSPSDGLNYVRHNTVQLKAIQYFPGTRTNLGKRILVYLNNVSFL